MQSWGQNKPLRWLTFTVVALVLIFTMMRLTSGPRDNSTFLEDVVSVVFYPFQVATQWVANRVNDLSETVSEWGRLREENASLRQQVKDLAQVEARRQELEQENAALRNQVGLQQTSPYKLLSAEVIGRDPNNWLHTIIINRGSRDGVEPLMAVVNYQGMVGRVQRVSPTSATVQLLIDRGAGAQESFGIGVRDARSGAVGIVYGRGTEPLEFVLTARDPDIQPGDAVETSGLAQLTPKRLLIGYVQSVVKDPVSPNLTALVVPAVDFDNLDFVAVVMEKPQADVITETPPQEGSE
jgi:rod shape-determining protein MreC